MAHYELKTPISYRSLSGFDLEYDLIYIEKTRKGTIQLSMSESTGLPASLDAILTAPHIPCPDGTLALKQHAKCTQISEELIRRGILLRDDENRTMHSHFVDYDLYQFNYAYFHTKKKNKKKAS